jgi:hypothetical protein
MDKNLSYLGMHLKIEQGMITVSMKAYVEALLLEYGVVGQAASPAKSDLFAVDAASKALGEKMEILSGLEEGEQIVVDNVAALRDGQPMTIEPQ